MTVAVFERFLKDEFFLQAARLTTSSRRNKLLSLPPKMQVTSVYNSLEIAMKGKLGTARKDHKDRIGDILAACKLISAETVEPESFTHTQGNPGPETLKVLLTGVGIEDPLPKLRPHFVTHWGAPVPDSFLKDKLEEIVGRRNRVAHTGECFHFSIGDLEQGLKFINSLVQALHEQLDSHFTFVISTL